MKSFTRLASAVMVAIVTLAALALTGCGADNQQAVIEPPNLKATFPITGTMTFEEVSSAAPISSEKAVLFANVSGFKVEAYSASIKSARIYNGDEEYVCRASIPVGFGFSGSPVVMRDGRFVGPLYAGNTGDKYGFYAGGLSILGLGNSRSAMTANRNSGNWFVRGIGAEHLKGMPANLSEYPIQGTGNYRQTITVPDPQPGSTVAVQMLTGPCVSIEAFGTLTHTKDGKWVAFGHPMDLMGERNLPVTMAYVDQVVDAGTWGVFKDCHSVGAPIGALVRDSWQGVVIDTSAIAETSPIVTEITRDGDTRRWEHRLARDKSSFIEVEGAGLGLISPFFKMENEKTRLMFKGSLKITTAGGVETNFPVNTTEGMIVVPERLFDTLDTLAAQVSLLLSENFSDEFEGASLKVEIMPFEIPEPPAMPE